MGRRSAYNPVVEYQRSLSAGKAAFRASQHHNKNCGEFCAINHCRICSGPAVQGMEFCSVHGISDLPQFQKS